MEKYSHIIGQQIFEIDFSSREHVHDLQNRISFVFNNQLVDRMERIFDELIPSNKHFRLDNLTLDIGNIPISALETDLADKILENLEEKIRLLLLHDNSAAEGTTEFSKDETGSFLSLFEYFLLKGTLPWWASAENSSTPFQALEFLLTNSAAELKSLIIKIGQMAYARKRLAYQFSEKQIQSIIQILEPDQAKFIFGYHAQVIKVQQQKQLVKSEVSEFKKAVWEFVLTYLLVDRGSHFNRKEFVKTTLASMSANFNVSYSELLSLFASAILPASAATKNIDSLQAIIIEISIEDGRKDFQSSTPEASSEKRVKEADQGVELIRYYFTFGSFPWWASATNVTEFVGLFENLVRKHPKTIETLILSVGKQEYSRTLIAKTFTEELLHTVIHLIEPDNAEFIIDYVTEIKTVHHKNGLVKAQSLELTHSVWEFILEYLLTDHGSEFNKQVFLERNIGRLANRFNLKYRELLVFMVNNIAVINHDSSRHLNLFHALTALYKISIEKEGAPINPVNEKNDLMVQPVKKIHITNLKNVIYFWLKYGYFPWWAGKFQNSSLSSLIEQFIVESEEEAILFFKHAGLKPGTRKRMVYQLPFETILKLFSLLPAGDTAVRLSNNLLHLLKSNKTIKYSNQFVVERVLLFSLWDNFIEGSYVDLKPELYVRSVIVNLALWFQIPVKRFFKSFKNLEQSKQFGEIVNEAYQNIEKDRYQTEAYNPDLLEEWSENHSIDQTIAYVLAQSTDNQLSNTDIAEEALSILRYFLRYNKLPDHYKLYSTQSVESFVKQLLLFLHQESLSELISLLKSEEYSGESFLRIHEIFSKSNSIIENNISSILISNFEKNVLLYISQHGEINSADKTMLGFIDAYFKAPEKKNIVFIQKLFKYSSVASQLAHFYKNETVFDLISNNYILAGWGTGTSEFLQSFNSWLLNLVKDRLDKERLDVLFRTFNFLMIGGDVNTSSLNQYLQHFFKFLFDRNYQLMLKLADLVQSKPIEPIAEDTLITSNIEIIKKELQPYTGLKNLNREIEKALEISDVNALEIILDTDIEEQRKIEKKLIEQEEAEVKKVEEAKDEELEPKDTIYIHNSGLVLLHPFLPTYFNRLQMLEKGDFITEEMRHRAVHLLQYLAFGTEKNEEHELVLNKILCNIPVDEPILLEITLTDHEKTVSRELLNAVLVQWDKLKNSSVESFQASFLQRDGALTRADENWNLKVEQRGYDVLLQTLPWSYGMIKTSWMPEFIYVEWM